MALDRIPSECCDSCKACCCLPFVPDRLGRPGAKGAALQASESVFRRVRSGLFVSVKRQPAIGEGNRNPLGLELLSAAAERGNCPAAKPNRKGLKGKRAWMIRERAQPIRYAAKAITRVVQTVVHAGLAFSGLGLASAGRRLHRHSWPY
jgi:hypothetical protein